MRDILVQRANALLDRAGIVAAITTLSGLHDEVRGIFRAPHSSPSVGYGMSSSVNQPTLTILFDDVPDIARGDTVVIGVSPDEKKYDIELPEPDEHNVLVVLQMVDAQDETP